MSHSYRKTPVKGRTMSDSEKQDKVIYHRSLRRATKQALAGQQEEMPHFREHSNPYNWNKDGKVWINKERDPNWKRK